MSAPLPASTARGGLPVSAVSGEFPQLLPGCLQRTLRLVLGAAFLHAAHQARQAFLLLGDIEPVDGLSEPESGVDARDHNAGVDGPEVDADQLDPHVGSD